MVSVGKEYSNDYYFCIMTTTTAKDKGRDNPEIENLEEGEVSEDESKVVATPAKDSSGDFNIRWYF